MSSKSRVNKTAKKAAIVKATEQDSTTKIVPYVLKSKDIKLTDDIFELFDGSGLFYIPNPWFNVENLGMSLDSLFVKEKKTTSKTIIQTPSIYLNTSRVTDFDQKTKSTYTTAFYINLFDEERRCRLFQPFNNTYYSYLNRLMIGFGPYKYEDYENNLLDLEYKLKTALEYLVVAKLFDIDEMPSGKYLRQKEESLYSMFVSRCKDVNVSFTEFRDKRLSLFNVLKLNDLPKSISKSNSIVKALNANDLRSNKKIVIKEQQVFVLDKEQLSGQLHFIFGDTYARGSTKAIMLEGSSKKLVPLTTNEYKKLVNRSHSCKFVIELSFDVSKSADTNIFNSSVMAKVIQCYVKSMNEEEVNDDIILIDI